jgi:hypothetical protein
MACAHFAADLKLVDETSYVDSTRSSPDSASADNALFQMSFSGWPAISVFFGDLRSARPCRVDQVLILLPTSDDPYLLLMKTTIDIADAILREARKVAASEGTTLRALVEQGLRQVIADKQRKPTFRLRLVTSGGRGLRPELRDASWDEIRDLSYEGHGG